MSLASFPRRHRDFLVMAKPLGPRCDLHCSYCYYVDNPTALGLGGAKLPGRMSEELLELFIAQRFAVECESGSAYTTGVHFEWHGGEPTLLGLDYYKKIAKLQRRLTPLGLKVTNGLQTNGTSLDGAWTKFLAEEGWSVGLSLDGPAEIHDAQRRSPDGKASHARVMRSYELLRRDGVFTNLLCVLTRLSADKPEALYSFFRSIDAHYLQFLPLVTPAREGQPHPAAAKPETIGDFLCQSFDRWIAADVGRVVVQNFDEALRPLYGMPHALCLHRERCGDALALERDGSLYVCDHFVDPQHRLGSIRESSLGQLADSPMLETFGDAKLSSLPSTCKSCELLKFCNGGCPKDRFVPAPRGDGLVSYLCPAYKKFYSHAQPKLQLLADHIRSGGRQREFKLPD